jgi:predicted transcriptional regulator of viral defense system
LHSEPPEKRDVKVAFVPIALSNGTGGASETLAVDEIRVPVDDRARFDCSECTGHDEEHAMGMEDYSKHQQKIIKRYYQNIDQIALQRLSELVADLYLAEGKKKEKLWESAKANMEKLKLPQARIDHLLAQKDPKLLANLVSELMGK